MTTTAKVFMPGRSQAVRLPKEFRFDVDEVQIERTKDGILLRTKTKLELFREFMALPKLDEDFSVDRNAGLQDDSDRPIPFSDWTESDWMALDKRRAANTGASNKSPNRETKKVKTKK